MNEKKTMLTAFDRNKDNVMESQWDIHNEVVATENEMKMIKINNWDDVGFENLFAITPCLKDERTNMPEQYAQMEYARTSKRLVLSWTDFNKNKNQFSLNKIVYSSPAYRWNSVKPPKKNREYRHTMFQSIRKCPNPSNTILVEIVSNYSSIMLEIVQKCVITCFRFYSLKSIASTPFSNRQHFKRIKILLNKSINNSWSEYRTSRW